MQKKPTTIRDIAKYLGMSEATVSLALNGNPVVKKETAAKVHAAADELGYVPNEFARRLVLKKSGMIGLVVPDIENVYYASLVKALSDRMSDSGYSLSIFISSNEPLKEVRAINDMISSRMEGIVYVPVNTPGDITASRKLLKRSGIPTVCATTYSDDMSCVLCDLEGGMKKILEHVMKNSPSRIAYLNGPSGVYTLDKRRDAILSAVKNSGIDLKIYDLTAVDYLCAYEAASHMAADLPDTIMCANDFMALGVVNRLTELGISVPERVSVTGFDDSVFSVTSPVPLTTVKQDIGLIASKTVEILLGLINDDGITKNEVHTIPTELIIRKSTRHVQYHAKK